MPYSHPDKLSLKPLQFIKPEVLFREISVAEFPKQRNFSYNLQRHGYWSPMTEIHA
jgi:hypothetical protein